jgi:hypothetical protein
MNQTEQQVKEAVNKYDTQSQFILQAYKDGLCTYEEAKEAQIKVSHEYKNALLKAFQYKF